MSDGASPALDRCLARWHDWLADPQPGGLDELLHDDVVFWSPVVFKPQAGKSLASLYLAAAQHVLVGENPAEGLTYVRDVRQGNQAVLEFEVDLDGTLVNGVDLITCDDEGRITDFKVMVRPLRGMSAIHEAMGRMLQQLS